jgi:hypothetical protein
VRALINKHTDDAVEPGQYPRITKKLHSNRSIGEFRRTHHGMPRLAQARRIIAKWSGHILILMTPASLVKGDE